MELDMKITTIPVDKIKPAIYNPRLDLKPGDIEYEKLKKSIETFKMVEPLIWNRKTGNLVGGHQRLKILIDQGVKEVEVSEVNLSLSKEKALNVALNKIQGDWDFPKLKDLLQELDTGEFDMSITGFDEKEIENLMTWSRIDTIVSDDKWDEKTRNQGSGTQGVVCFSEFGAGVPHEIIDRIREKIKAKWGDDPKVAIPAFCGWLDEINFDNE